MTDQLLDQIPSLDLADFRSGEPARKAKFVQELGAAYQNIGFVALKNHGLNDVQTKALYSDVQHFFQLPDDAKQRYENPELAGQRGYIGKGKEHAKGRNTGDLKEFYHVGQEVADDTDPIKKEYPANIWPDEVPGFQKSTFTAYRTLESAGQDVLRAIALYLELPENYFDDKVKHGNSILRPIHYFPIEDPDAVPADAVRAAEHGDINLITLLMGASADGLQVCRPRALWVLTGWRRVCGVAVPGQPRPAFISADSVRGLALKPGITTTAASTCSELCHQRRPASPCTRQPTCGRPLRLLARFATDDQGRHHHLYSHCAALRCAGDNHRWTLPHGPVAPVSQVAANRR